MSFFVEASRERGVLARLRRWGFLPCLFIADGNVLHNYGTRK